MAVANAPLKTSHKFEDMYQCDPSAKHYGFKSWDGAFRQPRYPFLFLRLSRIPTYSCCISQDFFTRKLHDSARPIASPDDDSVVANACESKVFSVARRVKLRDRFFVKSQPYSLTDMLAHDPLAAQFAGGTVYQAFLSALSYHRWHSPVSGRVRRAFVEDGTYFSEPLFEGVGDPANRGDAIDARGISVAQGYLTALATRAIIFIEADNPAIGLMAFIGVGMDEVSSCEMTVREGQHVKKGDQTGMFHFGGSSHCLLFRKGVKIEGFPQPGRQENIPVRSQLAVVTN